MEINLMRARAITLLFLFISFSQVAAAQSYERRLVYPEGSGVVLGQGWDSIRELPTPMICIEFTGEQNEYQDKSIRVQRVVDEATLALTTSITARAKAKAAIAGSGGTAKSETTLEYKRTVATNDTSFVVIAETRNGRRFAGPPKGTEGVRLTKAALEYLEQSSSKERFRKACGDSFVGSIEDGGRLFATYRFRHSDFDEIKRLTHDTGASGRFLGVGGGGGVRYFWELVSSKDHKQWDISFSQLGGNGGELPVDEASLTEVVKGFPKATAPATESTNDVKGTSRNAKPLYLEVASYALLPGFPAKYVDPRDTSLEERLAKYYLQLESLNAEVMHMYRNSPWMHAYATSVNDPEYYLWKEEDALGFDPGRIAMKRDEIQDELSEVGDALLAIESHDECYNPKQFMAVAEMFHCRDKSEPVNTDIYRWFVDLPIPRNAVPKELIDTLGTGAEGEQKYAVLRWYHYVLQQDRLRCEISDECLTREEKRRYLDQYLAAVGHVTSDRQRQLTELKNKELTFVEVKLRVTEAKPPVKEVKLPVLKSWDLLGMTMNSAIGNPKGTELLSYKASLSGETIFRGSELHKRPGEHSVFVGKDDFVVADITKLQKLCPTRFIVERYPVVDGVKGDKEDGWRVVRDQGSPFREVGPRDRDYVYTFTFQVNWCGSGWVDFGNHTNNSNCPSGSHQTTVRDSGLTPPYRGLWISGHLPRSTEYRLEIETRFLGTWP